MSVEKLKAANNRPSREEAEKAVTTLLRYIGEDPQRPGLLETPARVIRAYDEHYEGYSKDAADDLRKTFEDIEGYDDFVLVKNIDFVSHCEHHMEPIIGVAHVAYWPDKKIVGISKLARVVDVLAKRLTSQENMTRLIAETIENTLQTKGVAVIVEANHQCMSTRGVTKSASSTVTSFFDGCMKEGQTQRRLLDMLQS